MVPKKQTERIYYNYASAAPYEAEILELRQSGNDKTQIILDKTIFYPEGGGQPSDRGTINSVPVLNVQEKDGEILHLVSSEGINNLAAGPAKLILDLRRRRDHTQLHTGQHLFSGFLLRMYDAPTVSMHMGDENCTIDVGIEKLDDEALIAAEDAVADAIEENRPVIVHLCPPEDVSSFPLRKLPPQGEEVLRIVEIEGCDIVACCGIHLRTTAEIGLFRILGAEKYKGMTRISFTAGRRLLLHSRRLRQNAVFVSQALSVPVNEIGKGVYELLEKTAQTEKRLKALEEKNTRAKAEDLLKKTQRPVEASGPHIIVESYIDEDINEVLNIGKIAQKQCQCEMVFLLASIPDIKFCAFCSDKNFDLRPFLKGAFEAHGGRGGGGQSFFQGGFGTKEAMEGFLQTIAKAGGFCDARR